MSTEPTSIQEEKPVKRKREFPHTMVIIFIMIVLATIGTYLIPAGEYKRVEDPATKRKVVDVASFKNIPNKPVTPFGMFAAIPTGMKEGAAIIFFVFIMAGSFTIIQETGAINSALGHLLRVVKNDVLIIPIAMIAFSVLGFAIGASEEVLPFIPIAVLLARGYGYDDIVGTALVTTGAAAGFAGGMLNPFTTAIGQGIAGVPLYSGILLRTIGYFFFMAIAIWYVMSYAIKVKKDPTKSVLYGVDRETNIKVDLRETVFTGRDKLILLLFAIGMIIMVIGVLVWKWYINEIAALFIIMGLVIGIVGGQSANQISKNFIVGARSVVFAALIIGIARTILVIMQQGVIIDSIIYYMAQALDNLPVQITAIGMLLVNTIINPIIPSGSGLTATVMPIMAPLADVVGLTRQTAVLCVTYGDAFTNQLIPTSGSLLAGLGMANIPYDRWVKYNWKLPVIWTIVGAIFIAIAATINWGPV